MRTLRIFAKSSIYGENKSQCGGDEVLYVQVALQVTGAETYEREFGNLKQIKDNYPKYVVTMDPKVGLIRDSGIMVCTAREFLLNHDI